jgi:hypothetical protein
MAEFFSFLIAASGIVLLLTLIVSVVDKDGKWSGMLRIVSLFSAKFSAIFLALFVMVIANQFTLGILSFSTVGIYVACLAIIWSSARDLFGGSKLASDIATIAADQASKLQTSISEKASKIAEETKVKSDSTDQK